MYGLLGISKVFIEFPNSIPPKPVTGEAFKRSNIESGFSYGAGFEVLVTENTRFNIEYVHSFNDGYGDYSALEAKFRIILKR